MGRSLKIMHLADSHIGADWPRRPRHDRPRRGDDFVESFNRVLNRAFEQEVDLVIHAGDLFTMPEPGSRALAAASEALLALAVAGIPIVLVPGNHERHALSSTLLLSHPNIHVMSEPRTVMFRLRGTQVGVSAFACSRRNAAAKFRPALEATGWAASPADLQILAVHETFESATCGPGDFRFRTGDDVVQREAVPAEFDYLACGHIHRHQELRRPDGAGPAIVYAGSTDRISFAEALEPKGCVIIEEQNGRLAHTFVEHDVRPMSVWPMLVTDLPRAQIVDQVEAIIQSLPPRAIAQVRLAGIARAGSLRNVRFAQMIQKLRPDVLVTVSAQAVEFTERVSPSTSGASAQPAADAAAALPPVTTEVPITEVARLPTACGVYALYDATGRLLYVGKATNLRTRVRTHLRGKSGAHFFRGWGRQIARIALRATDSELEALLLEAEMIRSLQPAFNRQMRRWSGYCYLCASGAPHGQLEIRAEPDPPGPCFGPFRSRYSAQAIYETVTAHLGLALCPDLSPSAGRQALLRPTHASEVCRRYYNGICSGPCGGRVTDEEYQARIRRRNALLEGVDDTLLRELETQLETSPERGLADEELARLSNTVEILRSGFAHCATLHKAEALLNGLLLLPGPSNRRKVAMLTADGICLDVLCRDRADAGRILARHQDIFLARKLTTPGDRLPKEILDGLCIAARELDKASDAHAFIRKEAIDSLDASSLLALAFGDA
jgi:DNA repair protein SbcD/Mre11